MRVKKEYTTSSKENYERFLKEHKVSKSQLSFDKYEKIIKICNWMYVEYMLETGNKVKLPGGFGEIAVSKKKLRIFKNFEDKKYKNLRIDWKKTKEVGQRMYHTNEHTDGFNFKWKWFPKTTRIFLGKVYTFKPSRYTSRAITRYINKSPKYQQMYLEWEKN